jgi:hypothetical protein
MSWGTFEKLNLNLNKKAVDGVKGAYEHIGKLFDRWEEEEPHHHHHHHHRKGFIHDLGNLATEHPSRRRGFVPEYW